MKNERRMFIRFPVFVNYEIEVVVAKNIYAARSKRDKVYGKFEDSFHALHSYNKKGNALLVFPRDADLNCVAHECFHATVALMDWISNDASNECAAYHLGYLTQQVYKFVHGRSKRPKA